MNKRLEDMTEEELLLELTRSQSRSARRTGIVAAAAVVLVLVLTAAVVILVPAGLRTLAHADAALNDVQAAVARAETSMDNIDAMVTNVNTLVEENVESLSGLIEKISSIDFDKLSQSIEQLKAAVAPLSRLFVR